ncbi:hypothetical protein QR680_017679 [Steinernema hermaphroditum]|uniref:C2H2-type domain-containing protein n=1 Tax=Steinernema hermaphroditum TaxID=289476 RepID=A0AA39LP33_9BILA|nr:hypothetical protein QR680_017679 [Steinernema hermaphroditum]
MNEAVPPSFLNPVQKWLAKRRIPRVFHCVDCGEEFPEKPLFDEHVLTHQFVDICFQIQETEDFRFECQDDVRLRNLLLEASSLEEDFDKENVMPGESEGAIGNGFPPEPVPVAPMPSASPGTEGSFDVFGPAAPIALVGDCDRVCSLCFAPSSEDGILGHLLESHGAKATSLRALRKAKTVYTVAPTSTCEFCAEATLASDHDFFIHTWKNHIREGDELKSIRKPYKMILDVHVGEGTVGVSVNYDAPLAAGSYKVLKLYKSC